MSDTPKTRRDVQRAVNKFKKDYDVGISFMWDPEKASGLITISPRGEAKPLYDIRGHAEPLIDALEDAGKLFTVAYRTVALDVADIGESLIQRLSE